MDDNNFFILASNSPRRKHLLGLLGLDFTILPSTLERDISPFGDVSGQVRGSSFDKARSVADKYPYCWVLGADTVVVENGEVLGKPSGEGEALSMLMRLSGKDHFVHTGLTLLNRSEEFTRTEEEITRVTFCSFSRETAIAYVKTEEPLDKAGSYGAQGRGSALIERIEGSYTNVVGLPMGTLVRMLLGASLIEPSSLPGKLYRFKNIPVRGM